MAFARDAPSCSEVRFREQGAGYNESGKHINQNHFTLPKEQYAGVSTPPDTLADVISFRTPLSLPFAGISVKRKKTSWELTTKMFQILQGYIETHVIEIGLSKTETNSLPLQRPRVHSVDVHS